MQICYHVENFFLLVLRFQFEIPRKNPTEEEREALLHNISLLERLNELHPSTFSAISPILGQGLETGTDIEEMEGEVKIVNITFSQTLTIKSLRSRKLNLPLIPSHQLNVGKDAQVPVL